MAIPSNVNENQTIPVGVAVQRRPVGTINADRTPGGYVAPSKLVSDLAKPAYGR
jgi:hypothetical protein